MDIMLVKLSNIAVDSLSPQLQLDYTVIDTDSDTVVDKDKTILTQKSTISAHSAIDEAVSMLEVLVQQACVDKVIFDTLKVDLTMDLSVAWKRHMESKNK